MLKHTMNFRELPQIDSRLFFKPSVLKEIESKM